MKRARVLTAVCTVTALVTLAACAADEDGTADEGSGATQGDSADSNEAPGAQDSPEVDEEARALLPEEIREAGVLNVAASFRVPPLSMLVEDGEVRTGLSYDMATYGIQRLGLKPNWSNVTYPGQTPGILAGQLDLVWEVTSVNEERMEAATFVRFATANQAILVADGNPENISEMADLCGKAIGVSRGSVFEGYVRDRSDQCVEEGGQAIEISVFDGAPNGRIALQSGNVDGYMSSQYDTKYFADETEDGTVFDAVDLPEIPSVPIGIQVDKGNYELAEALEVLVNGMIEDGSYAEFFEAYNMPETMMVDAAEILG